MNKPTNKKDAFAKREAEKYQQPIPSREFIMEILADGGVPLTWQQLAELLNLSSDQDLDALQRRLRAMERDGQVIRNRRDGYGLMDKMDLVRGHISAHPDGFGFLIPEDGSDDLFLSARQMRTVFHRDRVVAHISGIDRRGRREGAIVEILQRNTQTVVGRFFKDKGYAVVIPDNKRITHEIAVPSDNQGHAVEGQIVVVELIEQPSKRRPPLGRVVEILGEHLAPGMEIDVAIRAHELPHEWPPGVGKELKTFSDEVDPDQVTFNKSDDPLDKGRKDIRHLPLITIDGSDARDFDDAVYCEPSGTGWRLVVAIADVSHYVKSDSALDLSAQERGNSVYFPGRVIPMLPELLSNGLCSINPAVNRMCMVCDMEVSNTGTIKSYQFYDAVMISYARMIYDDVALILDGDVALREKFSQLIPHLENLNQLYRAFSKQRKRRGTIEFETTETFIEFGPDKKIESIVPRERNDAHKIIEECMISANICAAKYLDKHDMPTLYRVHEVPSTDKLTDLREFLKSVGLKLEGGVHPEAKHYAELLAQVGDRPDAHLIQTVLLRSMKQATYTPENIGHFGLALTQYAHFTSPIRRYPDLLVHRALRHLIKGKTADTFKYSEQDMVQFGESCSMTERRADEATRDVVSWLKCYYMQDKVGEVFDGIITATTSFGIFVELSGIYVEGLVHVTSLSNDYYHFNPIKHCLVGEHTNQSFCLADKVSVKVARVDLDEKRMDFDLVGKYDEQGIQKTPQSTRKPRGGKKKSGGKGSRRKSSADSSSDNSSDKYKGKRRKSKTKTSKNESVKKGKKTKAKKANVNKKKTSKTTAKGKTSTRKKQNKKR